MFDVLYIPYRDIYFWQEYGSAVRDLQILELISENDLFDKIMVVNRPVSIYERFLNKKNKAKHYPLTNVEIIDKTSFSILGPLKKRAWTEFCYSKHVKKIIETYTDGANENKKLVVLDFTPIAKIPIVKSEKIIYWYDLIDNFTKHNVFTEHDKKLVRDKYKIVSENYNFVTAVSYAALNEIPYLHEKKSLVVSNGVFESKTKHNAKLCCENNIRKTFDFGFIGFITDKFDTDFVINLSRKYSVVVYGGVYDKKISVLLEKNGIEVKGKFKYDDLPNILQTFKIGLLPYLIEKSHDESPLKMYEYLKGNIPCLTSIDYEHSNEFVVNYNSDNFGDDVIDDLLKQSGDEKIKSLLPEKAKLKYKVKKAIEVFFC